MTRSQCLAQAAERDAWCEEHQKNVVRFRARGDETAAQFLEQRIAQRRNEAEEWRGRAAAMTKEDT